MRQATFQRPPWQVPVTRLRGGRVALLAGAVLVLLIGGTIWLLLTEARTFTPPAVDNTAWPAWIRQSQTYPQSEPLVPKTAEVVPDPHAALLAKLAALQTEMERQRLELEALKKRPSGTTIVQPGQQQAAKVTPPAKISASMLFVTHEVKDPPPPPKGTAYQLAPGATKLPCIVETAINSFRTASDTSCRAGDSLAGRRCALSHNWDFYRVHLEHGCSHRNFGSSPLLRSAAARVGAAPELHHDGALSAVREKLDGASGPAAVVYPSSGVAVLRDCRFRLCRRAPCRESGGPLR
jgi:hypothetical protein